jgi:hypothetical protein
MAKILIDAVIMIVIAIFVDIYVIGSQYLFNTTVGAPGYAITSVVVPLLQGIIIIGCILVAVLVLPKIVDSASGGK